MTTYNCAEVDSHKMFYREAGDERAPTIVLLHGFPTSSHMCRNPIPLLAKNFHVIAPDTKTREDIKSWFDALDLDDYVSFGGKP